MPTRRNPSRRLMVCTPMASRLASEGMTWSTRTGVQCTGASALPRVPAGGTVSTRSTPLGFAHCDGGPSRCAPALGGDARRPRRPGGRACRVGRVWHPCSALLSSLLAAAATFGVGAPSPAAQPATPSSVVLVGHGYGHGIGMGQWGSLGYALGADAGAGNFTYSQILTHYYGNTTMETLGTRRRPRPIRRGQRQGGDDGEQRQRPDRRRRPRAR